MNNSKPPPPKKKTKKNKTFDPLENILTPRKNPSPSVEISNPINIIPTARSEKASQMSAL